MLAHTATTTDVAGGVKGGASGMEMRKKAQTPSAKARVASAVENLFTTRSSYVVLS